VCPKKEEKRASEFEDNLGKCVPGISHEERHGDQQSEGRPSCTETYTDEEESEAKVDSRNLSRKGELR